MRADEAAQELQAGFGNIQVEMKGNKAALSVVNDEAVELEQLLVPMGANRLPFNGGRVPSG